ncbi:hypothetical protein GVN20_12440 [Runella sp. CRIBMP]|uniref:hypothetical protein n=1 Tax=Runella sp. CRIBMP TaxID=2683261 RepID=UPI001411E610|nr:hypothetical protein [Runella sp. CRIBMP]NBB20164.1 hypothetical protein [Runella sp. CRIBMP]
MRNWFVHIAIIFPLCCQCTTRQTHEGALADFKLLGPDSVTVGQKFTIRLMGKEKLSNSPIYLMRHATWGTTIDTFDPGQTITMVDTLTGWVSAEVLYEGIKISQKAYHVLPMGATMPLDTYLGSKSVIANGQDWAMLTAIPTDTFGNLVQAQTPVRFELVRPSDFVENKQAFTKHGVAYQIITAQTKAGKTLGYVSVDRVKSKEKELLEVADYPIDFRIWAEDTTPFADGRQTFKIKTDVLKDRFGNTVPDGTLVLFECQDANNTLRHLNGYTLEGIATIFVQNPISAGSLRIRASVNGGGKSNLFTVTFITKK